MQRNICGFLSIDIAFSLLIMSFAFILLLQAQQAITQQLHTHDIQNLYEANTNLFNNIAQNKCQKHTLTTKQKHTYNLCLIEGKAKHSAIILRYYTID